MKRSEAKKFIERLRKENEQWLSETIKADMDGIFSIIERVRVEKKKDFILELIQNADDCNSSEISFDLVQSDIIIQNNGDLFTKDNVYAICKLGKTTKESGKIGFMGFGFRAVFEVSGKSEIYSDNFSFHFEKDMIVPHWIEHCPRSVKSRLDKMKGRGSVFVLPSLSQEVSSDVEHALGNLSPTLLLYLQCLKRLRIGQETLQIDSGPFPKSFLVSRNHEERRLWKRYSVLVAIPKEKREFLRKDRNLDKIGKEPKKCEQISVTFGVTQEGKIADKQDTGLYAFLPLADERNIRFGFNIQADFSVDAGRRRLREPDSSWNQWILANVHKCFPFILEDYKGQRHCRTEFYKILPLNDPERPEYLNVVKENIDRFIKNEDSILVETRKSKKHPDRKKWIKPKYAVIADPELQGLFDGTDLKHLFGKRKLYVADDEIDHDGMIYIHEIVADELSFDKVISLLKDSRWILNRKIRNKKNPERWVGDLVIYFSSQLEKRLEGKSRWDYDYDYAKRAFLHILSDVSFLLTENKKLRNPEKTFLPPPEDIDIPSHLQKRYSIVSRKLVHYLEGKRIKSEKEKSRREKGLKLLREVASELSPETIVKEVINPVFSDDNWKSYSDSTIRKYTDFIRKHENCWGETKIKLKVETAGKEREYKDPNQLYLGSKYGNEFDLDILFKGYENGNFVSLGYIRKLVRSKSERARQQVKSWMRFFTRIGVKKIPKIREYAKKGVLKYEIEKELEYPEDRIRDTYWTYYYPGYEKKDYDFDSNLQKILFDCLNDKAKDSCKRLKVLLTILDKNWDYYNLYLEAKYGWHKSGQQGRAYERLRPSSFANFLRNSNWAPTRDGKHLKPEAVALSELKDIVRAPIIDYKITNEKFKKYLQSLGLQTRPTVGGAIAVLTSRVEQREKKVDRFREIYGYLAQHKKDKKRIRKELVNFSCIFLPNRRKNYWKVSEVFWEGSRSFLDWRTDIGQTYPELKDFFLNVLGVKEKPTNEDYVEFLRSYLWKREELTDEEKSSLRDVYHHLNYIATTPELKKGETWLSLREDFKIWCEDNYWAEIDKAIYYNDNNELYELFRKHTNMIFAYVPESVEVKELFAELRIKSLLERYVEECSVSAELKISEEEYRKYEDEIRRVSKYTAHFVRGKSPKVFDKLNREGSFSLLSEVKVKFVENLKVYGVIDDYRVPLGRRLSFYSWKEAENCLYLRASLKDDAMSCFEHMGIALSNAFGRIEGLEYFIPYIVGKKEHQIIQTMENYGIPAREKFKIRKAQKEPKPPKMEQRTTPVSGELEMEGEEPSVFDEFVVSGIEELTQENIERQIKAALESSTESEKKLEKKRVFRQKRETKHIKRKRSIRVASDVLPSAEKELLESQIGGETILLPPDLDVTKLDLDGKMIQQHRSKLCKIVESMDGNPDTVNVCWMDEKTDGFIEDEQFVFNIRAIRKKPLIFWIVLVAREMGYLEHGHTVGRYVLIKTMRKYIVDAHEKLCQKTRL